MKTYLSAKEIYAKIGVDTEAAVRKFQEIFSLPITGIVDKSTWYKIKYNDTAIMELE